MKIDKILIKNFKNIKETKIIDFRENVTLFVGPNGFGKTTIFDAVELSLTGKIRRIEEAEYSDGRSSFNAPYFQNDPQEDTLIELMLTNNKGESLIISTFYSTSMNSEGNNVPKYVFEKLERSIRYGSELSLQTIKNGNVLKERDIQESIGKFLGYESYEYSLANTFDLFNYVQQDETAYYLKQKEKDRKEQLNFLLNIEAYVDRKNQLDKFRKKLVNNKNDLKGMENKLQKLPARNNVSYEKLPLRKEGNFDFNNEVITFDNKFPEETLNTYLSKIDELQEFRDSFSPKDYVLRNQKEEFDKKVLNNKDFTIYLIFREIIRSKRNLDFIEQIHQDVSDETNCSYFLLRNYVSNLKALEREKDIFDQSKKLEELLDTEFDRLDIDVLEVAINKLSGLDFNTVYLEQFKSKLKDYKAKKEQLNGEANSINKLLEIRSRLREHIADNHSKCVFCGYDWIEKEKLLEAYEETTDQMRKNLSIVEREVGSYTQELNGLKLQIQKEIQIKRKQLRVIPSDFLEKAHSISHHKLSENFSDLVSMNSDIVPMSIDGSVSLQKFELLNKELCEALQKQLLIPQQIYDDFLRVVNSASNFEDIFEKYPMLDTESIKQYQLSFQELPIALDVFQENRDRLFTSLQEIKAEMVFDAYKSLDDKKLFETYFGLDEKLFNSCTTASIKRKREYIINQFDIQQMALITRIKERIRIIEQITKYLNKRIKVLNNNIKKYQEQMIQKLKLPFYMYTAKILQNYQQGMGVLLTTQNNSNIRFIANSNSEQDAMYQLSTGQIAVISFAFTLALNTTFKISKGFKFLAIDDPIQDMDSMNVYALIDVMRHSLPEHQIIMSTHNDSNAMFIKYKFELFSNSNISKVSLKNIKDIVLVDDSASY